MEAPPAQPASSPANSGEIRARNFSRGRQVAFILGVFLLSRVVLLVTAQVAWDHFGKNGGPDDPAIPHGNLLQLFHRADSKWYASIVEQGYSYQYDPATGEADGNVGFYPLYPLLVRAARVLIPDTEVAGQLVSDLLLLAACFLLWELAILELHSVRAAAWTVTFALFCPGTAWFSMVFSESTFLVLLLVFVWACRRQRWLLAAGAGFLLPLTRAIGIVVVVFAALESLADWQRQRRAARGGAPPWTAAAYAVRALACAAPVLGYVSFFAFLQWRFGDWHAQHKVIVSRWPTNAHLFTPWAAVAREWVLMHPSKRIVIYTLLPVGVALSALSYPALRRLSYPALAFAMITVYVIAAYHSPMARYLSVVVPIHLTLGWLADRSRPLAWAALAASVILMICITGAMVNGYTFY